MTGEGHDHLVLPDRKRAALFNELIRPTLTGRRQDEPVVVFVGGQPGAGKTSLQDAVLSRLGRHDAIALVGGDLLTAHPGYEPLHREDDLTAASLISEDLDGNWWKRAARLIRAQRLDVVISAPLGGPEWAADRFAEFRRAGYRVEAVFAAVHEAHSLQGVVDRFHRERQPDQVGYGRWLRPPIHDLLYRGVLDTVDEVDRGRVVNAVHVARRGGVLLHSNELIDGQWALGAATRQVIRAERDRPWTLEESAQFLQRQGRLRSEMTEEWQPLLSRVDQLAVPVISPLVALDDRQLALHHDQLGQHALSAKRQLDQAREQVKKLSEQFRSGEDERTLQRLQENGAPPEVARRARNALFEDRRLAGELAMGLGQQARRIDRQGDEVDQEIQRRASLDPKQRRFEESGRQRHAAVRPATAPTPTVAASARIPGHGRRGPSRGLGR